MRGEIREKLSQALSKIDRPGSFWVSGSAPAVLPGLEVHELGPVGLPLTAKQAKDLIKRCDQAPYGQGEKTVVDTSVRRVWRAGAGPFLADESRLGPVHRDDGRQGSRGAGAGEAEAREPSLRPAALRAGELFPAPSRRREARSHGRDAGRRASLVL